MAVTVPSFIPEPFANEGQKATIPDTPSSEQGRASWQLGFPQVCAQPLASGGIPPNYLDFQGIFNALSSSICYMQTGALWPWSAALTYPLGAHVLGSDSNEYVAVAVSGPDSGGSADPTTDTGAHWAAMPGAETERWRKSMIGSLVPMAVATLPPGYGLPDGSLFLFEDYPELKEKYDGGGFEGMLLEANASDEDKAAWVGKWVKHPQGLGLYAPRLQGLFLRNGGTAGRYNTPSLPNATGYSNGSTDNPKSTSATGAFYDAYLVADNLAYATYDNLQNKLSVPGIDLSKSNSIFGSSNTVMPASVDITVGLYLGRSA